MAGQVPPSASTRQAFFAAVRPTQHRAPPPHWHWLSHHCGASRSARICWQSAGVMRSGSIRATVLWDPEAHPSSRASRGNQRGTNLPLRGRGRAFAIWVAYIGRMNGRACLLLPLPALVAAWFVACGGSTGTVTPVVDSGHETLPDTTPVVDAQPDTTDTTDTADTNPADTFDATPEPWPTCDTKPDGATPSSIADVWTASAAKPTYVWVSGPIVTAISYNGCTAGKACSIFVQEGPDATTLDGAAHHAIKVFVSASAASRFTGIAVGDKVDIAARGWRYNISGENEILLQVADTPLRGCMKKTGTGTVAPVPATLAQLGDVAAYETKYGPVLVTVTGVSGKADASPAMTFGLWTTGTFDAGGASIVSLSPFCLAGGMFTGLTSGTTTNFSSVTGVFGLYYPSSGTTKYLELYPRAMADAVKL
jgi:hypothetical protein